MIEFRQATEKDVPLLAAWEEAYIECPWSARVLADTIADEASVIYLLTRDGTVLGYGGLKTIPPEAEVYNIVVEERARRQGLGRKILQKLLAHARAAGVRQIFLEVNARNDAALALYASCGFTCSRVRKNYYKSGDALVLSRTLTEKETTKTE